MRIERRPKAVDAAENATPEPQQPHVEDSQPEMPPVADWQGLSDEQALELQSCLNKYHIDGHSFIAWASAKGLLVDDVPENYIDISFIRQDQWGYVNSLFNHERSRIAFIQHLAMLAKKSA